MNHSNHRTTLLVISTGFLLIYLLFLWRADKNLMWMVYTAAGVSVAGLISKKLDFYIHSFWFWIADKMGFVMSKLILGVIFIVFLLPIGALSKLFRKDFMFLKKQQESYFKIRKHLFSSSDLQDPW